MNRIHSAFATLAAALVCAGSVHAQTMIGGGKTASTFPIVISQPGSYKLAGNLVVTDPTKGAIVVTAPDVVIDLNGYSISGPNKCTSGAYGPVTCTYGDNGVNGIKLNFTGTESLVVTNGNISGFAGNGINAALGEFSHLRLAFNAGSGLLAGTSIVDSVRSINNMAHGFYVSSGTITNSVGSYNGKSGFLLSRVSLTQGVATFNRSYGVEGYGSGGIGMGAMNLSSNTVGAVGGIGVTTTTPNMCNSAPC